MNILEEIVAYKKTEVAIANDRLPLEKLKKLAKEKDNKSNFYTTIKNKVDNKEIALIAEIKKASPSKGIIKEDFNPVEIAKAYKNGGASCLSVLTDEKYFHGRLKYINEIKEVISLPILRKDFIIDQYQIYESRHNHADCILLIVGTLEKDLLRKLYEISCENQLDCLIEVHNEKEMDIALNLNKPSLLGINNRDLKTFTTNLNITKELVSQYKRDLTDKVIVSESGISSNNDIRLLIKSNVYTFLVGEALIQNKDIEKSTKELINFQ